MHRTGSAIALAHVPYRFEEVDLWAMVRWRPGHAWFESDGPMLNAISTALDAEPGLAAVEAPNFP